MPESKTVEFFLLPSIHSIKPVENLLTMKRQEDLVLLGS